MIVEELKSLINRPGIQNKSGLYIRSLLKEYLQIYILNFLYLNSKYKKNFIFTGGTCLRQCFGLNRLSEDLDFDLKSNVDTTELKTDVEKYFKKEFMYDDLKISILQKGRQLLIKFPVLQDLGQASESESNWLYVKMDMSPMLSNIFGENTTLKNTNNFNYLVTHYDLPTLMASKVVTILTRQRLLGKENLKVIKGRDYFDLLWFLEKKVLLNLDRVNDLLNNSYSMDQLLGQIDEKVKMATTISKLFFKQDLIPFIDNPLLLDGYIENYEKNYKDSTKYLVLSKK
jgi:predicted nucleotidyltransferase component of viral defense system